MFSTRRYSVNRCLHTLITILASYTMILHPVALAQSDAPPTSEEEKSEEQTSAGESEGEGEEAQAETEEEAEGEEEGGESVEEGEILEGEDEAEGEDPYSSLEDAEGEDWLTAASSLAAGFVAASIARNCTKKTLDSSTVMAAGVAYLGAEIVATEKDKDTREKIEEDYIENVNMEANTPENQLEQDASTDESANSEEAKEDEDAQIKSLKAQEESYNELRGTAKVKMGFQYAAAGLLATASGMAIYQWTKEMVQSRLCSSVVKKTLGILPAVCTFTKDPTCPTAATACETSLSTFMTDLETFNGTRNSINANSATKMAELEAFTAKTKAYFLKCEAHPKIGKIAKKASVSCLAYLTTLHSNLMLCPGPSGNEKGKGDASKEGTDSVQEPSSTPESAPQAETTVKYKNKSKNIPNSRRPVKHNSFKETIARTFFKGINFLIAKANAFADFNGLMENVGIVGAGAGVALSMLKSVREKFDKFVAYPRQRAVLWTGMAGLITAAAVVSGNIEQELGENAEYTARVIQQYRNRSKDDGETNPFAQPTSASGTQNVSNESIIGGPINLGSEEDDGIPCFTEENQEGQCARLESLTPEQQAELKNVDPGLANVAQAGQELGEGLNNKKVVSSATLNKANELSGKHAFAVKRNKQLKNIAFQELGKDRKYGPVAIKNFENLGRGVGQFFKKSAASAFKQNGVPQGPLVSSFGIGTSASKPSKGEDAEKDASKSQTKPKTGVVGSLWGDKLNFGDKSSVGKFTFDDDEQKKKGKKGKKRKKSKKRKAKINHNRIIERAGINKNVNSDIFKIINLRYKKRFYPIISEE